MTARFTRRVGQTLARVVPLPLHQLPVHEQPDESAFEPVRTPLKLIDSFEADQVQD